MLVAGLVLAAAALYALLGVRGSAPSEAIDDASRAKLESVLREERSP